MAQEVAASEVQEEAEPKAKEEAEPMANKEAEEKALPLSSPEQPEVTVVQIEATSDKYVDMHTVTNVHMILHLTVVQRHVRSFGLLWMRRLFNYLVK